MVEIPRLPEGIIIDADSTDEDTNWIRQKPKKLTKKQLAARRRKIAKLRDADAKPT